MLKRITPLIIAVILVFVYLPTYTLAVSPVLDYEESWAKDVISHYIKRGVVFPDENGNIEPRKAMTRAEVAMLINNALSFTKTAEINYTDVTPQDSFYKDLQIAKGMGYMIGGGERQPFRPYDPITRQEMSILVARVLELQHNINSAKIFVDFDEIPTDEAKGAIGSMADSKVKVLEGIGDGLFAPNADITRDQAYTMIYRAEKIYLELQRGEREYSSVNIFQRETFGAPTVTKNYHNISIYSQEATLENIVIWGDLTIHGSVLNGSVSLDDITVKGNTYIYGGESIKISNSELNTVVINKESDSVNFNLSGASEVAKITASSNASINAPAMKIPEIVIVSQAEKNPNVSLDAMLIENIDINSRSVVNITNGIVQSLLIDYGAFDAVVEVEESASIISATVNDVAAIYGEGMVASVRANTLGAIILTENTNVTDISGNTVTTNTSNNSNNSTSSQNMQNDNNIYIPYPTDNTNNIDSNNTNSNNNIYIPWDNYIPYPSNNTNNIDNSNTTTNNTNTAPPANNNPPSGQQTNQPEQGNQNNSQGNNNNNQSNSQGQGGGNTNTQSVKEPENSSKSQITPISELTNIMISVIDPKTIVLYMDNYGDIGFNVYRGIKENNKIIIDYEYIITFKCEYGNINGMSGYIITLNDDIDDSYPYIIKIEDYPNNIVVS